jgi:CRISPR-associated endoribonuclease Cas6
MVIWGGAHTHIGLIIMAWQRALARGLGLRPIIAPPTVAATATDDDTAPHAPVRAPMGTATLSYIDIPATDDTLPETLPLWRGDIPLRSGHILGQVLHHLPETPDWLAQGCVIKLQSPLRLAHNGRAIAASGLTAAAVLTAMLRRCVAAGVVQPSAVPNIRAACTTAQDGAANVPDALDASAAAIMMQTHLRWRDASRYSATQQQATPLGGLVGNLVFTGDMRAFWPILHAAQWLHIGKETVFGLGGYAVERRLNVSAPHVSNP